MCIVQKHVHQSSFRYEEIINLDKGTSVIQNVLMLQLRHFKDSWANIWGMEFFKNYVVVVPICSILG
jgi:hypothetical protein